MSQRSWMRSRAVLVDGEHKGLVHRQEVGVGLGAAAEDRTQVEPAALCAGRGRSRRRRCGIARRGRRPRGAQRPGLRRIAEAGIGATLQLHLDVEILRGAREGDRHAHPRHVAIDDLLAEELVFVIEPDGQCWLAERDARGGGLETESVAIQVVARRDLEIDHQHVRLGGERDLEGRAHGQELVFGSRSGQGDRQCRQQQGQQPDKPARRQGRGR